MDPSCPSIVPADDTDSDDALVYACSILGSVIVLLIVALIFAIIKCRERNTGKDFCKYYISKYYKINIVVKWRAIHLMSKYVFDHLNHYWVHMQWQYSIKCT